MAGMRFSENLHPTHSHSWRPQLENPGHTNSHILILWPSASLYRFLSPAHTHIHTYSHTQGGLTSQLQCQWRWLSVQPLYTHLEKCLFQCLRNHCCQKWETAKKTRIRKKDSRKGEWGRYSREEVIATELTHIESNGSWGLWKISQQPPPTLLPKLWRIDLFSTIRARCM